jgi:multicomponent Na+:H+ antiporter subunit F
MIARLTDAWRRRPRLALAAAAVLAAVVIALGPIGGGDAMAAADPARPIASADPGPGPELAGHASGDGYGQTDDPSLSLALVESPLRGIIHVVCNIGLIVVIVGLVLCIIRALLGPHIADRVVASDLITLHIASLTVLLTIRLGQTEYFDVVLVVSLISFAGTIAFAQFLAARAEDARHQAERQAEHDAHRDPTEESPEPA